MKTRLLICLLATVCAGPLTAAAEAEIEGIRIWAAPDSTRVVFDLDGPVAPSLIHLSDPFRAVIDIPDTRLKDDLTQPDRADRYIRRLRSAYHGDRLRIVLDLKQFARSKSFQLPPNEKYGHRLVVDLYNDKHEARPPAPAEVLDGDGPRLITIAIDVGHGGEDPGSIGRSGTYEKDIALSMARKLAAKINTRPGLRAVLIREGDYFISLRDRIKKAREQRADLFVSIHADSFRDPRVSGSSVYVLSQKGASSEHARWLAEQENASDLIGGVSLEDKDDVLASVLLDLSQTASLEASISVADRVLGRLKGIGNVHKAHVESAAFAVLKSPDIPSLLVETAYISNPTEERRLRSSDFQDRLTAAILDGLEGYFRAHAPPGTLMAGLAREHIIGRGDTLSEIAQRYRVSVQSLKQANHLQSDRILIGQKLVIPSENVALTGL